MIHKDNQALARKNKDNKPKKEEQLETSMNKYKQGKKG